MNNIVESPADRAGRLALEKMLACLDAGQSFRLEAGAGAGKTFSLEKALNHLIEVHGEEFVRQGKLIGCITYTNVAKDEIQSRVNDHPAVKPDTIHGFCWSILQDFQTTLRELLPGIPTWEDRLAEVGGIGSRSVQYELGYPRVKDDHVTIRHEDVLSLMTQALAMPKFRQVLTARYPILLIDEYQDTDASIVEALSQCFLDTGEGPLIGLFGDHWQKIYGSGCGLTDHPALEVIDKGANFRSVSAIVDVLNRIRPELPQEVSDPTIPGEARVFHTNAWLGDRRTGSHWAGDTSEEAAKEYFLHVKSRLEADGWEFSVNRTKVLMLSHSILAREQGYENIRNIYGQYTDPWLKKEDPHIKFLTDQLEPACEAYEARRYGEMFEHLGRNMPLIRRHEDKVRWSQLMNQITELRNHSSIGEVIDFLAASPFRLLPEPVRKAEEKLAEAGEVPADDEPRRTARLRQLKAVSYSELKALDRFIDGHTPFATKHGVKGAQFENVLVVIGRGWNQYNFVKTLEMVDPGPPANKKDFYERNRNLLYVACSRPKVRLAILFTQLLSEQALYKVTEWFGEENVIALPADPAAQ